MLPPRVRVGFTCMLINPVIWMYIYRSFVTWFTGNYPLVVFKHMASSGCASWIVLPWSLLPSPTWAVLNAFMGLPHCFSVTDAHTRSETPTCTSAQYHQVNYTTDRITRSSRPCLPRTHLTIRDYAETAGRWIRVIALIGVDGRRMAAFAVAERFNGAAERGSGGAAAGLAQTDRGVGVLRL